MERIPGQIPIEISVLKNVYTNSYGFGIGLLRFITYS